ncbi:acetamidase/formamidase family protein [Anaerotignum lactatifermentans]|uniref:Acetamidase/formamidase family protein n=1 Tax=Anaerotignum lactatifermentans TaxID=160404 RepID=A0ABS2G859_9FIRM|nr:acetamidase/formamidase family protein [Anaerotignum lactatifermentans]MBM6828371.1 acetamidase/formamidase family protein [Anaerotignum lactatifermentans]MBM6877651.1 acetamidase/formamidase family protein [Anaerotignum lactatifermentans]MBM6949954.1 acetamidase/formamidase family protein [Anaerotignum lactatifermentans]
MKKITTEYIIEKFSKNNPVAAVVEPRELFALDTLDCFGNMYYGTAEEEMPPSNPATGAVYVKGAMPGDVLRIEIRNIQLGKKAVIESVAGKGCLGELVEEDSFQVYELEETSFCYGEKKLALSPMIGVLGTAPAEREIPTLLPGAHGGNLDCRLIKEGAVVYLPVFVEGGLLSAGDLHGLMADGEVGYSGLETYGTVWMRVEVISGVRLPSPMVYAEGCWYLLSSAETLDEAAKQVCVDLCGLLTEYEGWKREDTVRLLNLIGNLEICQAVNPLKTVRLGVGEEFLERLPRRMRSEILESKTPVI